MERSSGKRPRRKTRNTDDHEPERADGEGGAQTERRFEDATAFSSRGYRLGMKS
jgi:hypothetical protein